MLVVCPAFVGDCLESVEQIGMRAKAPFLQAGGESLDFIPCLRPPLWLRTLEKMTRNFHSKNRIEEKQNDN
jgi:ferrochelatase|tara:strand:- start:9300 stop:9512 length:213 start_codon:yes stop_codon:yes gene_type:complete